MMYIKDGYVRTKFERTIPGSLQQQTYALDAQPLGSE